MFLRLRKLFKKDRPVRASPSPGAGYGSTSPTRSSDLDTFSIMNPINPLSPLNSSKSDVFVRREDPAPVLSSSDSGSSYSNSSSCDSSSSYDSASSCSSGSYYD